MVKVKMMNEFLAHIILYFQKNVNNSALIQQKSNTQQKSRPANAGQLFVLLGLWSILA